MRESNSLSERAVIGCAVYSDKLAREVFAELDKDDFMAPVCAEMFEEIRGVWQKGGRLDAVLVSRLPHAREIIECLDTVPAVSNADRYIKQVKDAAVSARAAAIGLQIAAGTMEPAEILESAKRLSELATGRTPAAAHRMIDLLVGFMERHRPGVRREYIGTGFAKLDKQLYLSPGDMVVIGGRPSSGKTAFSIQLALKIAAQKKRVVYFSLETNKETIIDRMVACYGALPLESIKRNYDFGLDTAEVARTLDVMAGLDIHVVEAAGRSVAWMESEALRLNADAVVVDYLSLVPEKAASIYERVTKVSLALHTMAQKNHLLVIVLSQLNRAGAGIPTMEHLRESGQIEQDADVIMLLATDRDTHECVVNVAKNKEGIVGAVQMYFDGARQRFSEMEGRREE